jgi:hypothetical protein
MSEAEFEAAVELTRDPPPKLVRQTSNEEKLLFYGLYKQAAFVRLAVVVQCKRHIANCA